MTWKYMVSGLERINLRFAPKIIVYQRHLDESL